MTEPKRRGRIEFEQPTPFEPERIATMRKMHKPDGDYENPACAECYRLWPCQTSRLLTMIPDRDQIEHQIEVLEQIQQGN